MPDSSTTGPNRLERQLDRLSEVPAFARPWFRSIALRRAVPITGTAGLDFLQMTCNRVEIGIKNERKVQNHIGEVHSSAINLLAETATSLVIGMNVRDDCVSVARELKMRFMNRATGALRAVATLSDEQRAAMRASDTGQVNVSVTVTDEAGISPVECEFVWVWNPSSPQTVKS